MLLYAGIYEHGFYDNLCRYHNKHKLIISKTISFFQTLNGIGIEIRS